MNLYKINHEHGFSLIIPAESPREATEKAFEHLCFIAPCYKRYQLFDLPDGDLGLGSFEISIPKVEITLDSHADWDKHSGGRLFVDGRELVEGEWTEFDWPNKDKP
jgi:hypothetical protein